MTKFSRHRSYDYGIALRRASPTQVWDPHTIKEKGKIERINRRAARMVTNDYGLHSSFIAMLTQLGWLNLEQHRQNQRLTLMYKVHHGLVAVPTTKLIPADSRTRSNHNFKFRSIGSNSTPYRYSFFPQTIHDPLHHISRCVQASAS